MGRFCHNPSFNYSFRPPSFIPFSLFKLYGIKFPLLCLVVAKIVKKTRQDQLMRRGGGELTSLTNGGHSLHVGLQPATEVNQENSGCFVSQVQQVTTTDFTIK
jgi:hypothetical protein